MTAPQDIQDAKEQKLNKLIETELYQTLLKREEEIKEERPVGRPKKITTDVLRKLYEAFLIGSSDEEACFYANIGLRTMYDFEEANPDFSQLRDEWK